MSLFTVQSECDVKEKQFESVLCKVPRKRWPRRGHLAVLQKQVLVFRGDVMGLGFICV